jgi:glutathione synthase/RimK-type ligase-like ATP-grasp enzyme
VLQTVHWTEIVYYAKKAYTLYPGIVRPRSAPIFASHYARRRHTRSWARAALDAIVGVLFHAWVPWRARTVQRRFDKDTGWRRRAARIAHERFVDPNDLALFRIERAEELDGYIRRFEDAAFNKLINPAGWSRRCTLVDKRKFYARCAAHGIPHPAVIALLEGRALRAFDPPHGRPLIAKPSHGEGGRGVVRLPSSMSACVNPDAFTSALRPHLAPGWSAWIVQVALENHPALAEYTLDALTTARLTTMLDETGRPELVNAVLRLASRRGPVIDNMKAGGLILPLDLQSGRAGMGCQGYGGGDHTHYPPTGAPLAALTLPDWSAAVALTIDAHARAFRDYVLIGWDVAFSPPGPVIIEANAKPGVLMPQRSWRRGLAAQRYGELLAWHLEMCASSGRGAAHRR